MPLNTLRTIFTKINTSTFILPDIKKKQINRKKINYSTGDFHEQTFKNEINSNHLFPIEKKDLRKKYLILIQNGLGISERLQ